MRRAAELNWAGFELADRDRLRATVLANGARRARVTVELSLDGFVHDMQADDSEAAGTTGEAALDEAVRELVAERLSLAQDAAVLVDARGARRGGLW